MLPPLQIWIMLVLCILEAAARTARIKVPRAKKWKERKGVSELELTFFSLSLAPLSNPLCFD